MCVCYLLLQEIGILRFLKAYKRQVYPLQRYFQHLPALLLEELTADGMNGPRMSTTSTQKACVQQWTFKG